MAFVDAPSAGDRLDAWMGIVAWTRHGGLPRSSDKAADALVARRTQRLRFLLSVFESSPEAREAVLGGLARMLAETEGAGGLRRGRLADPAELLFGVRDRLMRRLLPVPRDGRDLARALGGLFPSDAEVERFRCLPPEIFHRLVALVAPPSARRSGSGPPGVRRRFPAAGGARHGGGSLQQDPRAFEDHRRRGIAVLPAGPLDRRGRRRLARRPGDRALAKAWRELSTECRGEMGTVRRRLEEEGVSIEIVFALTSSTAR